jgi:hypothetical protein
VSDEELLWDELELLPEDDDELLELLLLGDELELLLSGGRSVTVRPSSILRDSLTPVRRSEQSAPVPNSCGQPIGLLWSPRPLADRW